MRTKILKCAYKFEKNCKTLGKCTIKKLIN